MTLYLERVRYLVTSKDCGHQGEHAACKVLIPGVEHPTPKPTLLRRSVPFPPLAAFSLYVHGTSTSRL